jgi:hypothetical protein
MRLVPVAAILITLTGCWVGGEIRYRDHPDLTNITLAAANGRW